MWFSFLVEQLFRGRTTFLWILLLSYPLLNFQKLRNIMENHFGIKASLHELTYPGQRRFLLNPCKVVILPCIIRMGFCKFGVFKRKNKNMIELDKSKTCLKRLKDV